MDLVVDNGYMNFPKTTRKSNGEQVVTEFETEDRRDRRQEQWNGNFGTVVNPNTSPKKVIFHFMLSGEATLVTSSKQRELINEGYDPSTITERNLQAVSTDDIEKKTCPEYLGHQLPVIAGQVYNHCECTFIDVEHQDEHSNKTKSDWTFTVFLDTHGPVYKEDRAHNKTKYPHSWTLTVGSDLFYTAFRYIKEFIDTGTFTYTWTQYFLLPFSSCNPIRNLYSNCFSCAKMALFCLVHLKLGDEVIVYILNEKSTDVLPDDIYALLERFNYIDKKKKSTKTTEPRKINTDVIDADEPIDTVLTDTEEPLTLDCTDDDILEIELAKHEERRNIYVIKEEVKKKKEQNKKRRAELKLKFETSQSKLKYLSEERRRYDISLLPNSSHLANSHVLLRLKEDSYIVSSQISRFEEVNPIKYDDRKVEDM